MLLEGCSQSRWVTPFSRRASVHEIEGIFQVGMWTDLQNVEMSGFAVGASTGLDKTRADALWRVSSLDLSLEEVWNPEE